MDVRLPAPGRTGFDSEEYTRLPHEVFRDQGCYHRRFRSG